MNQPDFSKASWRKSSLSGDGGCVEVAHAEGMIGVRDTKDHGSGPVLAFTEHQWAVFVADVHTGNFDLAG